MASFVAVVAIHVTNYYCRAYKSIPLGEYYFSLAIDVLARFSVPCFFMISGALLLGREEPAGKNNRRIWNMLLVLLVWTAIYYIWNKFCMGTSIRIKRLLYVPAERHLWYLYVMIPMYMVLPFFQLLCRSMDEKKEKHFLLLGGAWIALYYLMSRLKTRFYFDLPLFGDRSYIFYFFLGFYLDKYKEKIRIGQKGLMAVFGTCMTAVFLCTAVSTGMAGHHYDKWLEYGDPLMALASAALFVFVLRIGNMDYQPGERMRKVIDSWCSCSFGIYLIHAIFLDACKKALPPERLSAWIGVPILTIWLLLLSYGVVRLLRCTETGRRFS